MSQSRTHSMVEVTVNMIVGFWLSVAAQAVIFPMFGYDLPLHSNMAIVAIFTAISMIRSYVLRRAFNWWHVRSSRCRNTA